MASRNGMFLKKNERESLIRKLESNGISVISVSPLTQQQQNHNIKEVSSFGTGCLCCGEDNDHANILLCEACNDEYHTYCLDPPLRAVPTGDWFCNKCSKAAPRHAGEEEADGLDPLVSALPPSYTARFGEVCWAQGGNGFGYWPSQIFDPRLTVGSARQLAKKNIGKRHLVYFFECHDAPFAVMPDCKIQRWEDGLLDDLHMGKAAKSSGKARYQTFQQAMQAATLEVGKPKEHMRIMTDWHHNDNHASSPPPPPSPGKLIASPIIQQQNNKIRKRKRDKKNRRGFEFLTPKIEMQGSKAIASNRNLMASLEKLINDATAQVNQKKNESLCCKVFKRTKGDDGGGESDAAENIGFVKLESRSSTFSDARLAIDQQISNEIINSQWRFVLPTLGPMSRNQEHSLGPLIDLIVPSSPSSIKNADGSILWPLPIYVEHESASTSPKQPSSTTDELKTANTF